MHNRPAIGVAVIVMKDEKILLGKRKGSHESGSWALPGGHLEFNELIEDCAKREVLKKQGFPLKILNILHIQMIYLKKKKSIM